MNPMALATMEGPKSLQTRASFPAVQETVLGNVQVLDEAGFAYLIGDIHFGATGREEIFQNIKYIITTEYFSCPLDREFGLDYSLVDKPMHIAEAILSQEVCMKISMYEPRAQFREITFVREEMIGKLSPTVKVVLLTTDELPRIAPVTEPGAPPGVVIEEIDLPSFYETMIELARVPGPTGPPGEAASIDVGTTTTGAPGTNAAVTERGTEQDVILDFTIPRGDVGAQGPPGAAATATAGTTTTGAPGTSASVVNAGTTSAAVFDFTIPRGDIGPQGIQGIQGQQGNPGTSGKILQVVKTVRSDIFNTSANATIPYDNTIPQITEGADLGLSLVITPFFSNSLIRLRFFPMIMQGVVGGNAILSVFRNGAVNAIVVDIAYLTVAGTGSHFALDFYDAPASISAQTYMLRAGNGAGNFLYFNSSAGSSIFNGILRTTFTAEEIAQ